ncbi:MAG TPA: SDR family oxidoreductase [Gaiellaceae bacterium]|jgi:NAD(P)-dependent dehydrogenase (short-subunit alcohol dehydrogenase family)
MKVIAITGASAGVGRATVRRFAREGASIGLIARGAERLEATAREVEQLGGEALVLPLDVADADAVDDAAARIEDRFGPLDVWVNNAMATVFAPVLDTTPDEFRRATEVTYLGAVWGTVAALRRMHARDSGTIVQVGSALAYRSIPLQAAYCGAKSALRGFTESLRTELLHEGSRVHLTMVELPALNTPQFTWSRAKMPRHPQPVPPIFQPEVAAEAIHYGATHRRRELVVGWPAVKAIYGEKVAPGLLDRYLARNGYDAQQTDEPLDGEREGNLFEPVPGGYAAHGEFGDESKPRSLLFELDRRRGSIAAAAGLGAVAAALFKRNGKD